MIVLAVAAVAYIVAVCWLNDRKNRRDRVEQRGVVRSKPRPYDWTQQ